MADTLTADLYTAITGDATLSALIGTRLYPGIASQDAQTPYCTYNEISLIGDYTLQGASGVRTKRIQISVFAKRGNGGRTTVNSIVEGLLTLLDGKTGTMGSSSLFHVSVVGSVSDYEADRSIYVHHIDFEFLYNI